MTNNNINDICMIEVVMHNVHFDMDSFETTSY